MSAARARVEAWIDAATRVLRPAPSPALVEAIAAESGLSLEGVRFVLRDVVEVDRARRDVERFLANPRLFLVGGTSSVAVVLSSTVPTAAFRAVAWALAQSERVVVRPSRRNLALVSALVSAASTPALRVELATPTERPERDLRALVDALPERGALHVYGGHEAIESARASTRHRRDLSVELHGPGVGAVLAHDYDVVERADAIAADVVAFDQKGCLSPRICVVLGDAAGAADALHHALCRYDREVPRGALDDEERAAIALACDAARFEGRCLAGDGHAVLDLGESPGAPIGPTGRVVPIVASPSLDHALARLRPLAVQLTHVATIDPWKREVGFLAPTCSIGAMQTPPFDGPVDRRESP